MPTLNSPEPVHAKCTKRFTKTSARGERRSA